MIFFKAVELDIVISKKYAAHNKHLMLPHKYLKFSTPGD
jgi:hypothetical protein